MASTSSSSFEEQCQQLYDLCSGDSPPNTSSLEALLKNSDNINAVVSSKHGHYDNTALHRACEAGHNEAISVILNYTHVAIDQPNKDGFTPFHRAACNGHTSTVKLLLDKGSQSIDKMNKNGETPLLCATKFGHTDTVQMLLEKGSKSIEQPTVIGSFPLHYAAYNGHNETMKLLLANGANPSLKNNNGQTALDTIRKYGQTPTFELLEKVCV